MRERVGHGEAGRREHEAARRGGGTRPAWGIWRRAAGPRPVRPGVPPVAVRPPEAPRPVGSAGRSVVVEVEGGRVGLRLLDRIPGASPGVRRGPARVVGGVALMLASAAVVVVLGLVAVAAQPAVPVPAASAPASAAAAWTGGAGGQAPTAVTAAPGETVWEVADRIAPELSGAERAAFAERIVTENRLTSVRLQPGQVLRVPGS